MILNPLTFVKIDVKALKFNLQAIRRLASRNSFNLPTRRQDRNKNPIQVLCVVKADAYGHGMRQVAHFLNQWGVDYFAVSDVVEGIDLRRAAITKPILLLESSLPEHALQIIDFHLTPTVCNMELAQALNRHAKAKKKMVRIHVKVDTGMGRLGVWHRDAYEFIKKIFDLRHLIVEGIYTHFPSADTDRTFTEYQIESLYRLVLKCDEAGMVIPYVHASNSMGLMGYNTSVLNLMRPGLMIYGLYPSEAMKKQIRLKPVLSVHSKVIFLKTIEKGRGISYGRTFIAKKGMKVATIPVGYSDGYLRALSNQSSVLIAGKHCRVLGRVTMDQIVVDVSHIKNISLGTPVVILGKQGNQEISADHLASLAATINYEIVCNLGNRLSRVYH